MDRSYFAEILCQICTVQSWTKTIIQINLNDETISTVDVSFEKKWVS